MTAKVTSSYMWSLASRSTTRWGSSEFQASTSWSASVALAVLICLLLVWCGRPGGAVIPGGHDRSFLDDDQPGVVHVQEGPGIFNGGGHLRRGQGAVHDLVAVKPQLSDSVTHRIS